jgi:hypothetical protein
MNSFNLELLLNPDTLRQHVTMVGISCFLGYMLGIAYGNDTLRLLRIQLDKLEKDLQNCEDVKREVNKSNLGSNLQQTDLPGSAGNLSNPAT